jgi:hypothetical protein
MRIIKLSELMKEYEIPKGQEIDMMPMTNWFLWKDICFVSFDTAYEHKLKEDYSLVSNKILYQKEIDELFKKYEVIDGHIILKTE